MCVCVCVYACVRWVNIGTFFPFFPPSLSFWLVQVLDDLICASWMETNRHKRGPLFYHGSYFGISCDVSGFFCLSDHFPFKRCWNPLPSAPSCFLVYLFLQQIRIWGILKIEAKNQNNGCCTHPKTPIIGCICRPQHSGETAVWPR